MRASPLLIALLLVGCGGPSPKTTFKTDNAPKLPPVTTLTPAPGPFNDKLTVKLTTDRHATIFVTTDGSDPQKEGGTRQSGQDSLELTLDHTTLLTFFAKTDDGTSEAVRPATYERAGGVKGTASGVVVVDSVAVGHQVALFVDGAKHDLGKPAAKGELPFTVSELTNGAHQLSAAADLNDDGRYLPVVDLSSQPLNITLDLTDPFKASAEGLKLYLGASSPGKCTLSGTVTLPKPRIGDTIRMNVIDPAAFSGGAQGLFSQLQNGQLLVADGTRTSYPYVITDLSPGTYLPVPALTTFGNGGLGINLVANPLNPASCDADQDVTQNFSYGPVTLSGQVTLEPQNPPSGTVYGVVAAKALSFTRGVQAVLMPVFFGASSGGSASVDGGTASPTYVGSYAGRALWDNQTFSLKVFTNLSSQNPIGDALSWTVSISGSSPDAQVSVGTTDVVKDLTLTVP